MSFKLGEMLNLVINIQEHKVIFGNCELRNELLKSQEKGSTKPMKDHI